jgi:hypothetical protein
MVAWRAISEAQSQVSDRQIAAGSPAVAAMTASPTVSESRPVNGTSSGPRYPRGARDEFAERLDEDFFLATDGSGVVD